VQYVFLVGIYLTLATMIMVLMIPFLLVKILANSIYSNYLRGFTFRSWVKTSWVLFASPVLILASLLVDLLALPSVLLRNEKMFEHKYQIS